MVGGVEGALVERWMRWRRGIRVWMRAGAIVVGWLRLVEGLWWNLRCASYRDRILRIVDRDSAASAESCYCICADAEATWGKRVRIRTWSWR